MSMCIDTDVINSIPTRQLDLMDMDMINSIPTRQLDLMHTDVINSVPTRQLELMDRDAINRVPTRSFDLATLAELSRDELQRHRWNGAGCDDSAGRDGLSGRNEVPGRDKSRPYCVELLRWALVLHSDAAWSMLQQCFRETVRGWIWRHPGRDVVLLRGSEENYIAQTFTRFWLAVRDQHVEFTTLSALLGYLHATLNGVLTDTLRSHLRERTRQATLPESGGYQEPTAPDDYLDDQSTWECIESLLPDERERRLAYLLYSCGLKPREIVLRCPEEFADVKEIYRLNANLVVRLRRNRERLRYLLYGGE